MNNYIPVRLSYNSDDILNNILRDTNKQTRALNRIEIFNLNRLLKLPYRAIVALYFRLEPNFVGYIHKDGDLALSEPYNVFALNFPLLDCDNTYMHWFAQKEGTVQTTFQGITSKTSKIPRLESGIKIESAICNRPNLVKINNWHSVDNYGTTVSKFISLRFATEVTVQNILAGNAGIEPTYTNFKDQCLNHSANSRQ